VVGIDLERDEPLFFPFIYWPVTQDSVPLSEKARARVQKYVDSGGVILFDIRDSGAAPGSTAPLRRIVGDLSLRRLVPMDGNHTLTKSFYLISHLRGSFDYNNVLVEDPGQSAENVSSVVIGENNWAGAWAATTLPEYSREREMALRAGINIVMFSLTGNYKSDQVHVQSIMERLGR
jgi:hypothetical protein